MKSPAQTNYTPDELVQQQCSDPALVQRFTYVDLWPSEALLINRYFKPGSKILDVGCGGGRTAVPMAKMGFQMTGIDFAAGMIDAARRQAKDHGVDISLRVMDASDMDFASGEFDGALFAFNGYELITTREKRATVLRSIARVLRPGGQLILTARSGIAFPRRWVGWCWMFIRQFLLRPIGLSNPHLKMGDQYQNGLLHHYITPSAVRQELQAAGFELELFNSPTNLDRGRPATFFTNFSSDISLFHVARKTG